MSDHELTGLYDQMFGDPIKLATSVSLFQAQSHRWPKDYAELFAFCKQYDYQSMLGHYDRVDFNELSNGCLEVCTVIGTRTNKMTVTEGSNTQANASSEPGPHHNFTK